MYKDFKINIFKINNYILIYTYIQDNSIFINFIKKFYFITLNIYKLF